MKKLLSLVTLLAVSSTAVAGFNGGNVDAPKMTVAKALKVKQDNAPVQITGKILRQVDNDEFIFGDSIGQIKIEVDDQAWQGLNVNPNETITIFGNVDHESFEPNTIDVYRVQK